MSTATPTSTASSTPVLFRDLLDDAAVFPPGLAPVGTAVADYRHRRQGRYAELIGPLLIGAGAVGDLLDVVGRDIAPGGAAVGERRSGPLDVTLIARPGRPLPVLAEAVDRVRERADGSVRLTGVELAHSPGWRTALGWGLPVAVEVGSAPESVIGQLDDIAGARAEGHPVRAKLRTQSTPDTPLPRASVLGGFLLWCVRHRLPFKLTGGLHHAVPTRAAAPGGGAETQHGLLNVLLATELADAAAWGTTPAGPGTPTGPTAPDEENATVLERVIATLSEPDPRDLTRRTAGLSEDRARALRTYFTSYGCCGVLDPIGELVSLGLLPRPTDEAHDDDSPAHDALTTTRTTDP